MKNRSLEEVLGQALGNAPERTPPADLEARVMVGLAPKPAGRWTRFRLWLFQPREVSFRPVQAVPAVALALILLVWGVWPMSPQPGPDTLTPVHFILHDAGKLARTVSVIGSFNQWQGDGSRMQYDPRSGGWTLTVKLPPGGYEYLFLVDGRELVVDPGAAMVGDDGFGNRNSILLVNGSHEQVL